MFPPHGVKGKVMAGWEGGVKVQDRLASQQLSRCGDQAGSFVVRERLAHLSQQKERVGIYSPGAKDGQGDTGEDLAS